MRYRLTELMSDKFNEDDIFNYLLDPKSQFTDKHKQAFLKKVRKFNELSKHVYREISLKEITKKIKTLGKAAEQMIMLESDDWHDKITLKRDVKYLSDSVVLFEKTSKEIHELQYRLESLFDDIGSKLSKYFEIESI